MKDAERVWELAQIRAWNWFKGKSKKFCATGSLIQGVVWNTFDLGSFLVFDSFLWFLACCQNKTVLLWP